MGVGYALTNAPWRLYSLNDDNIAEIDDEECVECETCVDVCPKNAISMREEEIKIEEPKKPKIFSRIRKYLY